MMSNRFVKLYSYTATFLLSSLIILIAGNYLLGAREYMHNGGKIDPQLLAIDARAYTAVYAQKPEEGIFDYVRQEGTHFEPYIHFRRDRIATKYVNVEESGLRKTIKNPRPGAKKVFLFGGSTVWGTGASDDATIPSFVQACLGDDFDVYNYGETGYVSTQELNQLLKALADKDIPDYVLFYDGNNDGYAGAYSPAIPRDPQKLRLDAAAQKRAQKDILYHVVLDWFEPSNYAKLLWRVRVKRLRNWENSLIGRENANAKKVVEYYESHIRQVNALAREYGFKAYFFWQPNLLNPLRKPISYEKDIWDSASSVFAATQRQVYYEAKKALSGRENEGVFFIADMFNEVTDPVYLDWSHTSMYGNRLVAETLVRSIEKQILGTVGNDCHFGDSQSRSLVARK